MRHLADGREQARVALPSGLRQGAVLLANGSLLAAADARLVCLDERGETLWRGRNRTEAASVAASWSQLADGGEVFFGGSTDGVIACRRTDDGALVWTRALGGGITALAPRPAPGGCIASLTAGGVLSVLDARGRPVWSLDTSGGRQDPEGLPSRLAVGGERLWVHSTGCERLRAFAWDVTALGSWPVPAAAAWVASGDRLVVADGDGVAAYAVR